MCLLYGFESFLHLRPKASSLPSCRRRFRRSSKIFYRDAISEQPDTEHIRVRTSCR